MSRGEKLAFFENNYWDFLDEETKMTATELKDKFGTDDTDLINAGREEEDRVELAEAATKEFDWNEQVELEYDDLTVTVWGNQRDADDWDEWEQSGSYTYKVYKDSVADTLWEFMTEEDAADVPGGLETLEDNDEWWKFLEAHFDELFEKYYEKLLDYYEDNAKDAASTDDSFIERTADYEDYDDYDD
jgi:hypothetical protein